MNKPSTILGVILCGGKSTRMGQDKAALPCPALHHNDTAGETFFSVATERLLKQSLSVVISGDCSIDHSFPVIQDQVTNRGPMQGVLASLEFAKSTGYQACLFTPIDVPFLTDHDVEILIKTWTSKPELTVAFSDRTEPLIAIYPTSLIDELRACIAKDQLSLMKWIKEVPWQSVAMPNSSCRNINRPADLN